MSLPLGLVALGVCVSVMSSPALAVPLDTAWTYQGLLKDDGAAANGSYDFFFVHYDAPVGGLPVGQTLLVDDVQVTDGLVTIEVDFGSAPYINGEDRYLEVRVRPGASVDPHTALTPRTRITATPYALESDTSLDDAYASGAVIDTAPGEPVEVAGFGGLEVTGDVQIGSNGNSGDLRLFRATGALGAEIRESAGNGHLMNLRDSAGSTYVSMAPDASAPNPASGGAFLLAQRSDSDTGMFFDGNALGTGEPVFFVGGSSQTMTFDAREQGDLSLEVPSASIDAFEILDEPGCAGAVFNDFYIFPTSGSPFDTIVSKTIVTPAPGKIVAIATMQNVLGQSLGPYGIEFGLALSGSDPAGSNLFSTALNTTTDDAGDVIQGNRVRQTSTIHRVFDAPASGLYTVDLKGRNRQEGANNTAPVAHLTLVYLPTDYSLTIPTLSEGVDQLRREQDELRARLERQSKIIQQLISERDSANE